jgi:hypothetical protein
MRINGQALQIETGLQHIHVRAGEMALDEFVLSNDPEWHPGLQQ